MPRRPLMPGQDRRQQILEAALAVFADEGFDGATNKAIAALADVTPGLIYFYFPSKEDLFRAVYEHHAATMLRQLQLETIRASDAPPAEVVPGIVQRFFDAMETRDAGNLMRVMMRTEMRDDDVLKHRHFLPFKLLGKQIASDLEAYFDHQAALGRLRPATARLAAHMVATTMMLLMVRRARGDAEFAGATRGPLCAEIAHLFLHGIDGCALPPDSG